MKISVLKNVALITWKHICWSLFLKKMQAWIIESFLSITRVPWFHFGNHTQSNQLIRKHVTYLVKKHLNVRSNYYNVSFLIEKSLLHNLTYISLLNSFLLLVLSSHVFHELGFSRSTLFWVQGPGPGSESSF